MARRKKGPARRAIERGITRAVTAIVSAVVRIMPLRWVRGLGNVGGSVLYLIAPRRRRLATGNLEMIFGERFTPAERKRIVLGVCRNMSKVFLELFKFPSWDAEAIKRLVPLEGAEHVRAALAQGKGAVLVTAHFGNWELLGARMVAEGFPMAVVARDASAAEVASIINHARESAGVKVFGRDELRAMMRHLRSNGCLGILPDQSARRDAIRLDFLGHPGWSARGTAVLALRAGCPIIVGFCRRKPDDSLEAYFAETIWPEEGEDREQAVIATMQRINDAISAEIRKYPDQWLWLHDRWKEI